MLTDEVYRPIGIDHVSINRTIEGNGCQGHPIMAYGYDPSLSDIAKIATLYQNKGRHGDNQILYAPSDRNDAEPASEEHGLPIGEQQCPWRGPQDQQILDGNARYDASNNCKLNLPAMEGWGVYLVVLMPERHDRHSPVQELGWQRGLQMTTPAWRT